MATISYQIGRHIQVLIPLTLIATGLLMPLLWGRMGRFRAPLALGVTAVLAALAIRLAMAVYQSPAGALAYFPGQSWSGDRFLPTGEPIGILIRTDLMGAMLLVMVLCLGFLIALYATEYLRHGIKAEKHWHFWTLLCLCLGGMAGISVTGDIFNTYVFLEVASISSYALVALSGDKRALEAAFKYTLVGAVGSLFFVMGIALLYYGAGTLNMAFASFQIQRVFSGEAGPYWTRFQPVLIAALGCFLCGLLLKMAIFPGHAWLADAHPAAPSPVSALLSGVFVKVTGVFILIRVLFDIFKVQNGNFALPISEILMVLAILTMILGSVFAIAQKRLKRMLAFSTISQMGYILLGISILTIQGLAAAMLYVGFHGIAKTLLFLCSGDVIEAAGDDDIQGMRGLGARLPVTMGAFTIGALGMVGVPFFNGFTSKMILSRALIGAGKPLVFVVLILSTILTAVYYLRVVGVAFLLPEEKKGVAQQPAVEGIRFGKRSVVLIILALGVILTGVWSQWLIRVVQRAVEVFF